MNATSKRVNTYLGSFKLLNSTFKLDIEFIESRLIHERVFAKSRSLAPFTKSFVKFPIITVSIFFFLLHSVISE